MDKKVISIIAPMYNEEEVVDFFFEEIFKLGKGLRYSIEIVCVNDGSIDNTLNILKGYTDSGYNIKVIDLSRNFGKEIALTAGIEHASGDAVIPIDCDLQDPPELIIEMIEKWESGFDVVLAKRIDRTVDTKLKQKTSEYFYKLMGKLSDVELPENVGDFRLMDRKVVSALAMYQERTRFMKGIFASLGFKQTTIEYVRNERIAGTTKWNYFRLYGLAIEGIISFSTLPLKVWSYLGASVALGSFGYGLLLILRTLIFGTDVPGYASLMVGLLVMSGLILLCLGIIGEYLSRIFVEVKKRPLYLVDKVYTKGSDEIDK